MLPEYLFHYRIRPGCCVRTEVLARRYELVAYLARKHPRLPIDPTRTFLLQLAETRAAVAEKPLRYRVVDRLNSALKRAPGLHRLLKRATNR